MADAISFDESFWIEEIDPADPESLSSVAVDYTPAFNLGVCFKDNFEVYLKYLSLLDPVEADVLILYYFCDKKVKEIASIMKMTAVKVSTLIHQAEARLAVFLHLNILLSEDLIQELRTVLPHPQDQKIFFTFLRELSRRRTAHQLGYTFNQVSLTLRKALELINSDTPSEELQELVKLLEGSINPPRETKQLDVTERVSFFDVITCPQEPPSDKPAYSFNLGLFENRGSHSEILHFFKPISDTPTVYFSSNQAIISQQGGYPWKDITPSFILRLGEPAKQTIFFSIPLVRIKKTRAKKACPEATFTFTAPILED